MKWNHTRLSKFGQFLSTQVKMVGKLNFNLLSPRVNRLLCIAGTVPPVLPWDTWLWRRTISQMVLSLCRVFRQ